MPHTAQSGEAKVAKSPSKVRMRQINRKQKEFYESRFADRKGTEQRKTVPAANWVTNFWASLRNHMLRCGKRVSMDTFVFSLHRRWMGDISDSNVLDLGCFDGNQLSLWIAERCKKYIGLDLSENAISVLNRKLEAGKLNHAKAIAEDLLDGKQPANSVDIVYAQGVVHHFRDLEEALKEIARIMRPDGIVITVDPMMTDPLNRFFRILYRPFQSNAAWEWPFTRKTFRMIEQYFEIEELQGYFGMARLGFPLMTVPGLAGSVKKVSQWGLEFDKRWARKLGLPFYFCWKVTMKLRVR